MQGIFELLEDAFEIENLAEASVDLGELFERGVSGDPSPKLSGCFTGQVKAHWRPCTQPIPEFMSCPRLWLPLMEAESTANNNLGSI